MAKRKGQLVLSGPGAPASPGDSAGSLFLVDLYIRVSTDRQAKEGDSLEEQEFELKKFCDYRGFRIRKIFIERGKSGGNTNRPEYQNLIKDIESGKIHAVVVKKLDRLSRSIMDFENLVTMLQSHNVEFISLRENFDTTTAMGKAMLRVALVFAQLEREQNSERTSDVMTYRASLGLHNGGITPFGYASVQKELVPYKREKEIIELIFEKFIETKSTTAVVRLLKDAEIAYRHNKPWIDTKIHQILQNPVYKGDVRWKGKLYPGIHPPIISEKRFEEVQTIFRRRSYLSERGKTNALLQKLVFCGYCSSPMTPSYALNRTKKKFYYYRCTSTHHGRQTRCQFKYVSMPVLDHAIITLVLLVAQDLHFKPIENRILKHNLAIEEEENVLKEKIRTLEDLERVIRTKKEAYLDSLIRGQFLSSERQRINDRLAELDIEEKQAKATLYKHQFELTQKSEEKLNLTAFKKKLIQFKTDNEIFQTEEVRAYMNMLFSEILYHPDKISLSFRELPWPIELPIPDKSP